MVDLAVAYRFTFVLAHLKIWYKIIRLVELDCLMSCLVFLFQVIQTARKDSRTPFGVETSESKA